MEENPQRNVGRRRPASESDFVPAARKLVRTPFLATSVAQKRPPWSLDHTYGKAEVPP